MTTSAQLNHHTYSLRWASHTHYSTVPHVYQSRLLIFLQKRLRKKKRVKVWSSRAEVDVAQLLPVHMYGFHG